MTVVVVNRHTYQGNGSYIGRGTWLGNPFTHIKDQPTNAEVVVATREDAVERYLPWLEEQYETNRDVKALVDYFTGRHMRGETVVLACSCKPESCHGDIVKDFILWLAEFGDVSVKEPEVPEEGDEDYPF